jgi:hypothetical protein
MITRLRDKGSENALSFAFSKCSIMPEEEPAEGVEIQISLPHKSEKELIAEHVGNEILDRLQQMFLTYIVNEYLNKLRVKLGSGITL